MNALIYAPVVAGVLVLLMALSGVNFRSRALYPVALALIIGPFYWLAGDAIDEPTATWLSISATALAVVGIVLAAMAIRRNARSRAKTVMPRQ